MCSTRYNRDKTRSICLLSIAKPGVAFIIYILTYVAGGLALIYHLCLCSLCHILHKVNCRQNCRIKRMAVLFGKQLGNVTKPRQWKSGSALNDPGSGQNRGGNLGLGRGLACTDSYFGDQNILQSWGGPTSISKTAQCFLQ